MGIDDVRLEAPGCPPRAPRQLEVATATARAPVEDSARDLVAALGQLLLEACNERAQVGVSWPRIHLGDEEDPQVPYPRVTWRIPRHISSVVPSPQTT